MRSLAVAFGFALALVSCRNSEFVTDKYYEDGGVPAGGSGGATGGLGGTAGGSGSNGAAGSGGPAGTSGAGGRSNASGGGASLEADAGCTCRTVGPTSPASTALPWLGLLGVALALRRRRES